MLGVTIGELPLLTSDIGTKDTVSVGTPEPEIGTGPVQREERPVVPVMDVVDAPGDLDSAGLKDDGTLIYGEAEAPGPEERVGLPDERYGRVALGFHVGVVNVGNAPLESEFGIVSGREIDGPAPGRRADETLYSGADELSELGCGRGGTPGSAL